MGNKIHLAKTLSLHDISAIKWVGTFWEEDCFGLKQKSYEIFLMY